MSYYAARRQQDHTCRETFSFSFAVALNRTVSKKAVISSPLAGGLAMEFECSLSLQRFLSGYSSFLQLSKEMLWRPDEDHCLFIACRCESECERLYFYEAINCPLAWGGQYFSGTPWPVAIPSMTLSAEDVRSENWTERWRMETNSPFFHKNVQ